jgi:carbonic anhydrase
VDKLIAGYQRFRAGHWAEQRQLFESLAAGGQRPHTLVVSCIDSRIDPAMIFDAGPGELLTVRNVANLVPPYAPDVACHGTSAALEFGIRVLGVSHVIVLGHELCGGVQALLEGAPSNARDFVAPWMATADAVRVEAARYASPAERQRRAEHEIIKLSLRNLVGFPWIAQAVGRGELALHGAWFSIRTGALSLLQADGAFSSLESERTGSQPTPR